MVPRGAQVTVVVGGYDLGALRAWDLTPLETRVSRVLEGSTNLLVRTIRVDTPSLASSAALGEILTDEYPYTATVVLQATVEFADIQDVASIVQNAFYQASSVWPTSAVPTAIGSTSTGLPSAAGVPMSSVDLGTSVTNLGSFLSNLTGSLSTVGTLALILAVGGVVLLLVQPKLRPSFLR
jgi:hypothetical protein